MGNLKNTLWSLDDQLMTYYELRTLHCVGDCLKYW